MKKEHFERIKDLSQSLDEKETFFESVYECTLNADASNVAFIARIEEEVIGVFVLAKDVNLDYYKSHFHI